MGETNCETHQGLPEHRESRNEEQEAGAVVKELSILLIESGCDV